MVNRLKNTLLRNLALIILVASGAIMAFMLYDLNKTEDHLARSLISKPMESTEIELKRFFNPIKNTLLIARDRGRNGAFDSLNIKSLSQYFIPLIRHFPQVSSMGIANTTGYEQDVLPEENHWLSRTVSVDDWGWVEKWHKWETNDNNGLNLADSWEKELANDPRERPWFQGALNTIKPDEVFFTDPYIYNTTNEPGITVSVSWNDRLNDTLTHIMAFDLTLLDITRFTTELHVSKNGKAFILAEDEKLIGLPKDDRFDQLDSLKSAILLHPGEVRIPSLSNAVDEWKQLSQKEAKKPFTYEHDGQIWWAQLKPFPLGPGFSLNMGIIVPESDMLAEVQRTRNIILVGFAIVLLLTTIVLWSYSQTRKANVLLEEKNRKISSQKSVIEEKNKDIMDSIAYANRIQHAILPTDEMRKKLLPQSFIFFKPKDIVSGDFYWIAEKNGKICFTASDCTGHGVPGAFMSMIGSSLYNQVVLEKGITEPASILNEVRKGIVMSLDQKGQEGEQKDGMDAAFCALSIPDKRLEYAGANNSLYVVTRKEKSKRGILTLQRNNEEIEVEAKTESDTHWLFDIKPDKQPIGYYTGAMNPFSNHVINLNEGDTIYVLSDGYPDQFGGEKGKKFKYTTFKKLLLSIQNKDMQEQYDIIDNRFTEWKRDYEQIDDVCIIGVRV